MYHAEDDWNEYEGCAGGQDKAADHGTTEWRVLLASFAKTQGHRRV